MTSQPASSSSHGRLLVALGGALVIAVIALLILANRSSNEPATEPTASPARTSNPQPGVRPPSLPTPTGQASAQNRPGTDEEPIDESAPPLLNLPVLNELDVPCSEDLSDQFIAHMHTLRDAGIDPRTLVEQIVTRISRQAYGSTETENKRFANPDDAHRYWVDRILGAETFDNWRANKLDSPPIEPRADGSLDPAFTALVRRLQKSGVDEQLLANVVAGQVARQLGVATEKTKQQHQSGEISADEFNRWQRNLIANRHAYFEDAIGGVLGSQALARYERAKLLITYPCGVLALLNENQVDQLYQIRKEWSDQNRSSYAKLKANEIDSAQFNTLNNEARTNYQARKLALLGPELDPKFP